MSRREPKAEPWLRQQLDELGALRNASVRDPQFKAWRQNTLTIIQRIWPEAAAKSERFRRIPFSPPSTRHDARVGREQFERGCGEAFEYLNVLLASLGDASKSDSSPAAVEKDAETFAGDFPVIELGHDSGPPIFPSAPFTGAFKARPADPKHENAQARSRPKGPPELPATPALPAASDWPIELFRGFPSLPENDAAPNPLPPAASRPPAPDSKAEAPEKFRPQPAPSEIPSAPRASRAPRGRKGGKQRLKEMLGLSSLEVPAEFSAPAAETEIPPPPAETEIPPPPAETEIPPPPAESASDHGEWSLPEFMSPHASTPPLTASDIEPAQAEPGDEARDDARATADFLMNSPVLSSVSHPAQRRAAESRSIHEEPLSLGDSVASELLAIAGEVDALGVPEGHRARARAALTDLARHLDEHSLSWEVLRDAVNFIMEYPPLARRALPLLLPYLDRAA